MLLVLGLAGCGHSRPAISDPTELAKECGPLESAASGPVDPKSWPAAVQELHPVELRVDHGNVIITTFRETGVGAWGYIVANQPPSIEHYTVAAGGSPDLYTFDLKP